jgi:hypothetical protein
MARIALQLFCVAALGAAVAAAQSGDRRALAARGVFRPDARRLSKTEDPDVLRAVFDPANAPLRTGPTRVCQPGAAWIRLDFAALRLEQGDRLSVRSDGGDHYEFSGGQWQGGPAHLRALRGACLDVQPHFAHSGSAYRLDGYRFAKFALTQSAVVVAAAGDICDTSGDACMRTSNMPRPTRRAISIISTAWARKPAWPERATRAITVGTSASGISSRSIPISPAAVRRTWPNATGCAPTWRPIPSLARWRISITR